MPEGSVVDKAEKARAYNRAYHQANKEKRNENARKYQEANRVVLRARKSEYREKNKELIAASKRMCMYGITREQYDEKLSNQQGLCAICGEEPSEFHVDHCHATGKVRGLLCGRCNFMLGHARDSSSNLQNAIAYLEYHHGGEE